MPLSVRDRKLLWARAGGVCALCKSHLTTVAKSGDRDVVLREEAHVVSEEPNGPRFRPMPRKEVDSYANLLLLCPSHHKIVDEQVSYYTEQRLQTLKRKHEQWVKDRVSPTIPAIKIRDPEEGKPVMLQRIDTGIELMNVLAYTLATHHDNPDPRSIQKAELIGRFLQNASDYRDIWDEIEPSGRIQADFSMSGEITRLREAGLVAYAGVKKHIIEGGVKAPEPWPVAYLVIRISDDDSIKASSTEKQA
jgi:hypothetical protein